MKLIDQAGRMAGDWKFGISPDLTPIVARLREIADRLESRDLSLQAIEDSSSLSNNDFAMQTLKLTYCEKHSAATQETDE